MQLEAKREARRYRDEQRVEVRVVMEGATTKPWIKTESVDGEGGKEVSEKAVTRMIDKLNEADALGGVCSVLTRDALEHSEAEASVVLALLACPVDRDGGLFDSFTGFVAFRSCPRILRGLLLGDFPTLRSRSSLPLSVWAVSRVNGAYILHHFFFVLLANAGVHFLVVLLPGK